MFEKKIKISFRDMVTVQVYFIPNLHILDWFQGYNIKPVSAVYRTSNSDYGSRPPSVHTMPTKFCAKSQKFSEVRFSFNFLPYRFLMAHNIGLVSSIQLTEMSLALHVIIRFCPWIKN